MESRGRGAAQASAARDEFTFAHTADAKVIPDGCAATASVILFKTFDELRAETDAFGSAVRSAPGLVASVACLASASPALPSTYGSGAAGDAGQCSSLTLVGSLRAAFDDGRATFAPLVLRGLPRTVYTLSVAFSSDLPPVNVSVTVLPCAKLQLFDVGPQARAPAATYRGSHCNSRRDSCTYCLRCSHHGSSGPLLARSRRRSVHEPHLSRARPSDGWSEFDFPVTDPPRTKSC